MTFAAAHGIIMMKGEARFGRHGGAGAGAETERKGDMVYRFEEFLEKAKRKLEELIYDFREDGDWEFISEGGWEVQRYGRTYLLYLSGELVLTATEEREGGDMNGYYNEYGEPNPALLDVFNEMLAAAIVAGETELEKGDWRIRLFPECAVLYRGGEEVYSEPTDVFVYGDQSPEFWKKLEGE